MEAATPSPKKTSMTRRVLNSFSPTKKPKAASSCSAAFDASEPSTPSGENGMQNKTPEPKTGPTDSPVSIVSSPTTKTLDEMLQSGDDRNLPGSVVGVADSTGNSLEADPVATKPEETTTVAAPAAAELDLMEKVFLRPELRAYMYECMEVSQEENQAVALPVPPDEAPAIEKADLEVPPSAEPTSTLANVSTLMAPLAQTADQPASECPQPPLPPCTLQLHSAPVEGETLPEVAAVEGETLPEAVAAEEEPILKSSAPLNSSVKPSDPEIIETADITTEIAPRPRAARMPQSSASTSSSSPVRHRSSFSVLLLFFAIAFLLAFLTSLAVPDVIVTPLAPACSDCTAMTAVDVFEGPGTAVEYAKTTFLVRDSEAAAAFIANPEQAIPTSSLLAIYTSSSYWSAAGGAHVCRCYPTADQLTEEISDLLGVPKLLGN
jgi:hypothetical protein